MNTQLILTGIGLIVFFVVWNTAVKLGGNFLLTIVGGKVNHRFIQMIIAVVAIAIFVIGVGVPLESAVAGG
ncbi:MAG: hypothetical protein QGM50_03900 [Anaerolineae bacterium]|nr:hypothetical protein [Anaerolineae bacterium]MDK1081365.1 hypothetical protein [Anaerolineae bacterium]MDK1117916.1 hypothetical protein [Anaerolineae bacterium]